MEPTTNLRQLAENYSQKRRIDDKTLNEIVYSISTNLLIKPNNKILDIGCGTGRILLPLATKNKKSSFIGLDVSSEMLDILNTEIRKQKIPNVEIKQYDANNRLPFGDQVFDLTIWYHSYHIVRNKKFLASEIERILKPGGHLLIASTSHSQLATTLNYKFIPEMLKKEFVRTPDLPVKYPFFCTKFLHVLS